MDEGDGGFRNTWIQGSLNECLQASPLLHPQLCFLLYGCHSLAGSPHVLSEMATSSSRLTSSDAREGEEWFIANVTGKILMGPAWGTCPPL